MGRSLSVVATAAATAGNNASTPPLQGQSIYGTGQYRVWAVAGTYQWTSPITGTARGRVTRGRVPVRAPMRLSGLSRLI